MRILVTGYTGQLGYDVVQFGQSSGLDMIGVGSNDLDIRDGAKVIEYMRRLKPDAIIHCAAYTAVDKAEDDRVECWKVNVEGTRNIAIAAKELNAILLYISTDYVFNGEGESAYDESSVPDPIGYYGLTKYEGERIVQQLMDQWFIVRISWVFGLNGNNFVKTMLRLAETRDVINVVHDQIGSPTYTQDLARLLIDMIQSDKFGIYHATNEGFCSWAEFAEEIFRQAQLNVKVKRISSIEYPTRAKRPKNSKLSKQMLVNNGFDPLPLWQDAVRRFVELLIERES